MLFKYFEFNLYISVPYSIYKTQTNLKKHA